MALLVLALVLVGCVSGPPRADIDENLALSASVVGYKDIKDIRSWGDEAPANLEERIALRKAQVRERYRGGSGPGTLSILAVSGGGENGAFGAGLLNGWSESGTRPEFELVTGISTGALIAPFAFLGPTYDQQMKEIYTTIGPAQVFRRRVIAGVLGGSALADPEPLAKTIARYANQDMLDKIAAEHRRGRRLLIGTTNLDLGRPVIWDIGEIANSGQPDRLELFQKILLASASIPGAFPPVRIEVTAAGKIFDELHVDGGVANQVFAYPPEMRLARFGSQVRGKRLKLYIIRNSTARPEFAVVKPRLFSIGARSTFTLIKMQGVGDLYRLYMTARRDGLDYNLALIPDSFDVKLEHPFDTAYMQALFQVGDEMGRSGISWQKGPPGFD